MSVFEHAMQMEMDGRDFYLAASEKTENPMLKKILLQLADDENKHYALFKALRDGMDTSYDESSSTSILSSVKNIFIEMKESGEEFTFDDDAQTIWAQAREVEKKAEAFYREKSEEVEKANEKTALLRVADEEHKHWVTLDNVIQFLDKPKTWLEDAEWNDIEEM